MATNTAPQWLKNTGVFDHSTLVLTMCYCFVYITHYKSVCNTMQVYKHVSVNLVIPIHTACAVRIALYHVPLINSGELSRSPRYTRFVRNDVIAERLSARQQIPHCISEIVSMYVCMYVCIRHA